MEVFWKAAAIALLSVILGTAIGKTEKDMALILMVSACCVVLLAAIPYLREVVAFLWQLSSRYSFHNSVLDTLLNIAGVALVTEVTGLITADAGSSALGKAMQLLGNAVILFLSIPLLESLLLLVQEILGAL